MCYSLHSDYPHAIFWVTLDQSAAQTVFCTSRYKVTLCQAQLAAWANSAFSPQWLKNEYWHWQYSLSGYLTVGLASHWPRVTESVCIHCVSIYGPKTGKWAPLCGIWQPIPLPLPLIQRCNWCRIFTAVCLVLCQPEDWVAGHQPVCIH